MRTEDGLLDYSKYYNKTDFFLKLGRFIGVLGVKALESLLVLYYLLFDKSVPLKMKGVFAAALGYFIFPADLIADFLPAFGFADDVALITFVISQAKQYITPEIKEKAAARTRELIIRNT
ncbi:MAG: DUF1232 domain-containing protein [Bacteroidetes bacterium]|nr:MAG: DUF1232 domain-containing protein [Bacteroidota bacterium]RLD44310.1 MAG: DUF1232 domain-containing protein [Bacteroidota bacterium]RLD73496.1 MAG: DUF1232 domain-containing protein [Bacteroidota bacterium]RLD89001.1 MAG: DUF1232 domain-containing protein [Bacteroidota bacterium]